MNPYRSRQWGKFKSEIIEIDGGRCTSCGRSKADGVVLQVHHKRYLAHRKPWEYPHELCFTLCRGCHAAEHGLIPPKFGWSYAGWDDLGSVDGTCECCGKAIRYTFLIDHPKWFPLEVGEVCCDNLTSEQAAHDIMDSQRRYRARLKTFLKSKRWHSLSKGIYTIHYKGYFVQVYEQKDGFHIRINQVDGKQRFEELGSAKESIFHGMESNKIQKYVAKYGEHT